MNLFTHLSRAGALALSAGAACAASPSSRSAANPPPTATALSTVSTSKPKNNASTARHAERRAPPSAPRASRPRPGAAARHFYRARGSNAVTAFVTSGDASVGLTFATMSMRSTCCSRATPGNPFLIASITLVSGSRPAS
ncbi:hypothetical protein PHYC_03762 [Phycisphaerales bacterium]|nr:hypothetical protein PHYC_03762 [Phycisphaerales bacterium]